MADEATPLEVILNDAHKATSPGEQPPVRCGLVFLRGECDGE
jgi:hypothetical protein